MDPITKNDLVLVNSLSSRSYTGNRLLSNASEKEKDHLKTIIQKLKVIAEYFSEKYNHYYGPFETSVSTGNAIAIGGKEFKRVWSGIFKGAPNKQYAAQISFVMNPKEACLDVGFYFGRASGHSLSREQKVSLEKQLKDLGTSLSDSIIDDSSLQERYHSLFDFGFKAFSNGNFVPPNEWYNFIRDYTKSSQIFVKIHPNDFDIIENSTIDLFVSKIIFLMGAIKDFDAKSKPLIIKPLTPEQIAKEAERLALIGQEGELFAMQFEKDRLSTLGIQKDNYPRHMALESTHHGFDILSLDENKSDMYIEVKTTTRSKDDKNSRRFFLSSNEYKVFLSNKKQYKIYRVYDVENHPNLEILELDSLEKIPDGYIVKY